MSDIVVGRATCLSEAAANKYIPPVIGTLNARLKTHGQFKDVSAMAQDAKDYMRACNGWAKLTPMQKESLDSIVGKIARILSGDPNQSDHWHDIAGYATLVERNSNNGE